MSLEPVEVGTIQIFAVDLSGKSIGINVALSWNVGYLKDKIAEVTKVPTDWFRLTFNGKTLADNKETLASRNIEKESNVRMESKRAQVKYDAAVAPILTNKLNELKTEGQGKSIFTLICLGCYDHGHGSVSIKRQQCPDGLLALCVERRLSLRIVLVDPDFGPPGGAPQIYDIDTKWQMKQQSLNCKVMEFEYDQVDARLFTFATSVLPAEYAGTQLTLAGVDLAKMFQGVGGSCLVVGNFYALSSKPSLALGDSDTLSRLGYR